MVSFLVRFLIIFVSVLLGVAFIVGGFTLAFHLREIGYWYSGFAVLISTLAVFPSVVVAALSHDQER